MISQEHLDLWVRELSFQLAGIINVDIADTNVVTVAHLNKKIKTIHRVLDSIKYDMEHDEDTIKLINDTLKDMRQIE